MKRALKTVVLGAAVLATLTGVISAESVYLKTGSKITGKVLEDGDDKVRVQVELDGKTSVITIDKRRVDRIETDATRVQRLAAAQALLELEEFQKAENDFRKLVHNEPKDARARLGLARALVGIHKYSEAVKTLEHHLQLAPEEHDADLMMYLALQYLEAREYRDAKKTAREAAGLKPDDETLQIAADEFRDRVDRVRNGTEQLKERVSAQQAAIKARIEERREWNQELGNSFESVEVGQGLADWVAESWPKLILGRYLDLNAQAGDWRDYQSGNDVEKLRKSVTRCQMKFVVDEPRWLGLYDHQKSVVLYGWYYQLRELYWTSFPVVTVVTMKEERGKQKEFKLARASWDGRRDQIIVERWTKENHDPGRPRPRLK